MTRYSKTGSTSLIITDEGNVPAEVDNSTHSIQTIEYEHHEIHSGSHFEVSDFTSSGTTFVLTTQDSTKWAHFLFEFSGTADTAVYLYEGTTSASGGTSITPVNNNRNSTVTSMMTVVQDPTAGGATGAAIEIVAYSVGTNKLSGASSRNKELILKQNTHYSLVMASAGVISYELEWYEHTAKD